MDVVHTTFNGLRSKMVMSSMYARIVAGREMTARTRNIVLETQMVYTGIDSKDVDEGSEEPSIVEYRFENENQEDIKMPFM